MMVDRQNNNRPNVKNLYNIKTINSYIYLSSLVTNQGGCSEEIRRAAIAKQALTNLKKIWKRSLNTRIKLIKTLVFSVFLYGSECWTLNQSNKKTIPLICSAGAEC